MAFDWIKMRTDIYRDPKVIAMSDYMLAVDGDLNRHANQMMMCDMRVTRNVMRNVIVGALVTLWGVVRHQGKRDGDDLRIDGVTVIAVDDIADLPGLGEAMEKVGWVVSIEGGISFPRFFSEHNADPADNSRSKNAERQRRFRSKNVAESNVTRNVTDNVTVTHREEKRREEISLPNGSDSGAHKPERKPRKVFVPPSLEQVREYALSRASPVNPSKFFDHYEANGWRRGKSKMADWQATFRTWEATENDKSHEDSRQIAISGQFARRPPGFTADTESERIAIQRRHIQEAMRPDDDGSF